MERGSNFGHKSDSGGFGECGTRGIVTTSTSNLFRGVVLFFEEALDDGGGHTASADKCNFYGHVMSVVCDYGLESGYYRQMLRLYKSKWISEYRGDAAFGVFFYMNISFKVTDGMTSDGQTHAPTDGGFGRTEWLKE